MKLVIELAETEDLDQAVRDLLTWYESPGHISPAGAYILIMDGLDPPQPPKFGWPITGLEVERKISDLSGHELMAAIREETGGRPA